MTSLHLTWTVEDNEGDQLLRTFLREGKHISRKCLADIKHHGGKIIVNGQEKTVRYQITKGDIVEVVFPTETVSEGIYPTSVPFHIVFEDDYLLVINKPSNLTTIPSRDHQNSLAGAVIHYYQKKGISSTFHAVNRLDRETSGLMLVAKYRHIHDLFVNSKLDKRIKRTYGAIVHGRLEYEEGTIDAPIGRKDDSIIEREVRPDGQRAVTHYQSIQYFKEATLVEVELDTGRTHQIRVHFSHLGHPLIGDTLYGGKKEGMVRQALHSWKINFIHPLTKEELHFTCPLPEDINEKLHTLK